MTLENDRITPQGGAALWLQDADFSAMYRRGSFSGPVSLDLAIDVSATPLAVEVGDVPTYSVIVTHDGDQSATGVELRIRHPAGLELTSGPNVTGAVNCDLLNQEVVCRGLVDPGLPIEVSAAFFAQIEGQYPFSVSVAGEQTDPDTANNIAFFEYAVHNDAPTLLQAIPDQSVTAGISFSLDVSTYFSDPNGESLQYSTNQLPSGLQLSATSGLISGTPTTAGSMMVTVTAMDASGASTSDSFTIATAAPTPPAPPPASDGGGGGGGSADLPTLLLLLHWIFLCRLFRGVDRRDRLTRQLFEESG